MIAVKEEPSSWRASSAQHGTAAGVAGYPVREYYHGSIAEAVLVGLPLRIRDFFARESRVGDCSNDSLSEKISYGTMHAYGAAPKNAKHELRSAANRPAGERTIATIFVLAFAAAIVFAFATPVPGTAQAIPANSSVGSVGERYEAIDQAAFGDIVEERREVRV